MAGGERNELNYTVLVGILTDGEENASREFTGQQVQAMVERLKQYNWLFTYMGANQNVQKMARSLFIHQSVTFQANEVDIKELFEKGCNGRMAFYEKRSKSNSIQDAENGYFVQP